MLDVPQLSYGDMFNLQTTGTSTSRYINVLKFCCNATPKNSYLPCGTEPRC